MPLTRLKALPLLSNVRQLLGSNRVSRRFAAYTRMKIADQLDVAASRDLTRNPVRMQPKTRAANQQSRLRVHTQENKE